MLELIVNDLIKSLPVPSSELARDIGYESYLIEYRTIGCYLPRRRGKSTTLKSLNSSMSSLLLQKRNGPILDELYNTVYRGRNLRGLKYEAFLLDEYPIIPKEIYTFAKKLYIDGLLTPNFFILSLSTPAV